MRRFRQCLLTAGSLVRVRPGEPIFQDRGMAALLLIYSQSGEHLSRHLGLSRCAAIGNGHAPQLRGKLILYLGRAHPLFIGLPVFFPPCFLR